MRLPVYGIVSSVPLRARQLNACARVLEKLARSFTLKAVTKFVFDPSSIYGWVKNTTVSFTLRI